MSGDLDITPQVQRVHRIGMRVNNLFQHDDGSWQANVRDPGVIGSAKFFAFGEGATPTQALEAALEKAVAAGKVEAKPKAGGVKIVRRRA